MNIIITSNIYGYDHPKPPSLTKENHIYMHISGIIKTCIIHEDCFTILDKNDSIHSPLISKGIQ